MLILHDKGEILGEKIFSSGTNSSAQEHAGGCCFFFFQIAAVYNDSCFVQLCVKKAQYRSFHDAMQEPFYI